jgi:uncharacterized protein (DUF1800 family)
MMASAQTQVDVAGIERPAGTLDMATALEPYRGALDERLAAHLLRRAGFGGTPQEIARYATLPVNGAVESLIRFPSTAALPQFDDLFNSQTFAEQNFPGQTIRTMTPQQRREFEKASRRAEVQSMLAMQLWWMNRMLQSPAPLQEKMTLYFHGHFTTAAIQKNVMPRLVFAQNQLFRSYALGNLRELTRAVSKDPAMMLYLDNASNSAAHPNENFARELMELFTLGVDHYSEQDVRESARAWTGLRYNKQSQSVVFEPSLHDAGTKTFLGQTGAFNGDDIINIIFKQRACAVFFASNLLNLFVYNDPEPPLVDGVADLLQKHDFELAPVVSAILRSNVFYSPRAYRALVKGPVEFIVGTYKTLGLPQLDQRALAASRQMGQVLFYPPNVAGWPGGSNWLTSETIIARQNFLARTITSQNVTASSWLGSVPMQPAQAADRLIGAILQDDVSRQAEIQLNAYLEGQGSSALGALSPENFGERISGAAYLTMATPAFQLS